MTRLTSHSLEKKNIEITGMDEVEREAEALSRMTGPYKWAMYDNWEQLKQYYISNRTDVLGLLATNNDTALHVVAFAGRNDVLNFLILLLKSEDDPQKLHNGLIMQNSHGNTALHEVAASGNLEAAKLLVDHYNRVRRELARRDPNENDEHDASYRGLVEIPNQLGETPLYRAAAFGHTKLVKYFADQAEDKEVHFRRSIDKMSILHIAVIGQHFETALWLQKNYQFLANRKESNGFTSLQLLAQMPSAFRAKFHKSIWKMIIYKYLSYKSDDDIDRVAPNQNDDLESRFDHPSQFSSSKKITRWPRIGTIFEEMKNQKSLSELTHLLVEKDYSWVGSKKPKDKTISLVSKPEDAIGGDGRETKSAYHFSPLLIATSTGIAQIVKKIFELHPQAVEAHDIDNQQNILHMAIKHRQLEIFKLVRRSKSITSRMASRIDSDGNTILHHAADMRYYSADTQRVGGPALQLQEELRWMVRVEKIVPRHYTMHHNNNGLTAGKLFNSEHAKLLESAQAWIKETAQSCSTVAALVATVVYAAAYTAPGGNDSNGVPVLRHSSFFITFAVMDSVSLISSLSSVVTFLSILTSPFEYENFYRSLPFRLHLGFALLFFSLVTTMLTFTATILLLIRLNMKWTTSLIYAAAFLPVSVFGLMQFPLYKGFSQGLTSIFKKIRKLHAVRYISSG